MINTTFTRMSAIAAIGLVAWVTHGLTRGDDQAWSPVVPSTGHTTEVETAVFGFG